MPRGLGNFPKMAIVLPASYRDVAGTRMARTSREPTMSDYRPIWAALLGVLLALAAAVVPASVLAQTPTPAPTATATATPTPVVTPPPTSPDHRPDARPARVGHVSR